jgi:hypothetical protein
MLRANHWTSDRTIWMIASQRHCLTEMDKQAAFIADNDCCHERKWRRARKAPTPGGTWGEGLASGLLFAHTGTNNLFNSLYSH